MDSRKNLLIEIGKTHAEALRIQHNIAVYQQELTNKNRQLDSLFIRLEDVEDYEVERLSS